MDPPAQSLFIRRDAVESAGSYWCQVVSGVRYSTGSNCNFQAKLQDMIQHLVQHHRRVSVLTKERVISLGMDLWSSLALALLERPLRVSRAYRRQRARKGAPRAPAGSLSFPTGRSGLANPIERKGEKMARSRLRRGRSDVANEGRKDSTYPRVNKAESRHYTSICQARSGDRGRGISGT